LHRPLSLEGVRWKKGSNGHERSLWTIEGVVQHLGGLDALPEKATPSSLARRGTGGRVSDVL
jgi:hypothetical protein